MTDLNTMHPNTLTSMGLDLTGPETAPALINGVPADETFPVAEMQASQTPTLFESVAISRDEVSVAALEAVVTKKHSFSCANLTRGGVCDC
jgi:hypothetical protein